VSTAPSAEPPPDREDVTLAKTAYRRLRQDIMAGVFAPGQPLRLELLRQRYGLSFSPLREALNRLQAERLVTSAALRGFSVAPLSAEEMWDATDTRILVESEALRRAIKNGDDDWEIQIVAAFHGLELQARRTKARTTGDEAALLETRHREFHHALIAKCASPRLLSLADQLYAETQRYRAPSLTGRSPAAARDVAREHREIMEATLDRATAKAVALLAAHYRRTAEGIEAALGAR
jgi:GntR family transcriptional regulator, carbon starvation induced regulator